MTVLSPLVLVVEDDPGMRRLLRIMLESNGMRYAEAISAKDAIVNASDFSPNLIITDLGLSDGDGFDVIKRIRLTTMTPIVVLSAQSQEFTKSAALDAGANDYITKPFAAGELLERLRIALRRTVASDTPVQQPSFEVRDLRVDLVERRVSLRNEEVHLTPIEYRLLVKLIRKAGQIVTQSELQRDACPRVQLEQHDLRLYMAGLRRKLELDPAQPIYLLAETGVGYRLIDH
jgi:two-component system KDP operon response regulator KdpE